jgi:hypothetical protein
MLGWAAIAIVIHTLFFSGREIVVAAVYFFSTVYGAIFGLLSCRRSVLRDIRIHDRMVWSWTGPIMISIPAFIIIAYYVAVLTGSHVQIVKDTVKAVMALFGDSLYLVGYAIILSLFLWLPLVLLSGLRSGLREDKEIVNYGIMSTLLNASRAGIGMFFCVMLGICIPLYMSLDRAALAASVVISLWAAAGFAWHGCQQRPDEVAADFDGVAVEDARPAEDVGVRGG